MVTPCCRTSCLTVCGSVRSVRSTSITNRPAPRTAATDTRASATLGWRSICGASTPESQPSSGTTTRGVSPTCRVRRVMQRGGSPRIGPTSFVPFLWPPTTATRPSPKSAILSGRGVRRARPSWPTRRGAFGPCGSPSTPVWIAVDAGVDRRRRRCGSPSTPVWIAVDAGVDRRRRRCGHRDTRHLQLSHRHPGTGACLVDHMNRRW